MVDGMKPFAMLLALIALSACATAPAGPSETRRFSGVYVNGWEVQLFIEEGRENENDPYWVSMSEQARASMEGVLPDVYEPGEGVNVRTQFEGRLSPPGQYGHLGAFRRVVLIENVITAGLIGRPAAYCDAEASVDWQGSDNQRFAVTASTSGPTCRQSVALLIVRNAAGSVVWTDAMPAAHVMGLNGPPTRTPMSSALAEWIGYGAQGRTTAELPPWPRTNIPPNANGFEFAPEPWLDRSTYLEMRARAQPMFCYVQGLESLACLVMSDEGLEKIGVQSFPG
jgi:hypothetical protein